MIRTVRILDTRKIDLASGTYELKLRRVNIFPV